MVAFDAFRHDLATALLDHADRRRRSGAGGAPTGEDLKTIALLERLAADAKNLDLQVYLLCQLLLTHEHLAQRFEERRHFAISQLGVTYVPKDATDLVRWMNLQCLDSGCQHDRDRALDHLS